MGAILTAGAIQASIDIIGECMKKFGLAFEMPPIDEPGLGNIAQGFIELIEESLVTMFKPIAELKIIITDYLAKPPEFLEKIASFIKDIADFLLNPIEFLINKILKPLIEKLNMPIMLNLGFLIPGLTVDINLSFLKLPQEIQDRINKMLEVSTDYFQKLMEFILLPIKLMIGLIEELVKLLVEALADPIGKLVALVAKITTDFVGFITDIVGIVLEPILKVMLKSIVGVVEGVEEVVAIVLGFIKDIFSGVKIDFSGLLDHPLFGKIAGFVGLLLCFMKFFFTFITTFPGLFFK